MADEVLSVLEMDGDGELMAKFVAIRATGLLEVEVPKSAWCRRT